MCFTLCNALQHTVVHCNTLRRIYSNVTHCSTMQCHVTHCNTLLQTATHCNTLQFSATPRKHTANMQIHGNMQTHRKHTANKPRTRLLQHTAMHCKLAHVSLQKKTAKETYGGYFCHRDQSL